MAANALSDIDLRTFLRNLGTPAFAPGPTTAPPERVAPEDPAELLEANIPLIVDADPTPIDAFVDGTQSITTLTWREHRPVHLMWVAAGAVGAGGRPLELIEDLRVTCAEEDREWLSELGGDVPLHVLAGSADDPGSLDRDASRALGAIRETLERQVVTNLLTVGTGAIVVDGSLVGRPTSPRLMGMVKTTATRYLEDESVLRRLPVGWRSPRFTMPNRSGGPGRSSCYLRLFDASTASWDWGLVRIEAFDPELLPGFCARALAERQNPNGTRDPRWDRHLTGVRSCEEFLKSRRPGAFH